MRYYFDENNVCVGVQGPDDVGVIDHESFIDDNSEDQLYNREIRGVLIDDVKYPLTVLKNNNGAVEINQDAIDSIISEQYKLLRSPKRDVDIAFADANNLIRYPSLEDQLDNLWHDINDGVFGDDVKASSRFYSTIKAVKDTYPKGQ